MAELETPHRKGDDAISIEIKLSDVMQIYDSMDPAPFYEKALDKNAEEYIVGATQNIPLPTPQKLVIFIPNKDLETEEAQELEKAIHNHFVNKSTVADHALKEKLFRGRISLALALMFLVSCLAIRYALASSFEVNVWTELLREGLLIIGWVAMWEPINVFIYGWWPLVRERRIFEKLQKMPVVVVPYADAPVREEGVPKSDGERIALGKKWPDIRYREQV